MKKILLLFIMLTATTALNLSWAQLGVGQQMQNNNFEEWYTEYNSRVAPTHWHSLNSGTFGSSVLEAGRKDFVSQSTDKPTGSTGSYSVQLKCVDIYIIFIGTTHANGGLTSGRFHAGSTSADNTANCTYTSTVSGYNQTITAYPDSIYVWTKTNLSNSNHKARFNIVIHNNAVASNNAIYQDRKPHRQNQA